MHDHFDPTQDADLLGEVELLTELITAASKSEGRLSMDRIDDLFKSQTRHQ